MALIFLFWYIDESTVFEILAAVISPEQIAFQSTEMKLYTRLKNTLSFVFLCHSQIRTQMKA